MSASPEFYKPAAPAAFNSPCASPLQAAGFVGFRAAAAADDDYYSCRTPTGSGITYLKEPTTCPPAPRKPPAPPVCKKRLFHHQQQQEEPLGLISVRLDELERIFRPVPPTTKRRSLRHKNLPPTAAQNTCTTTTTTTLDTNSS